MDESDGAIFDALRVRFLELRGMIRVLEVEKARLLDEITRNEELLHNKDQEKEQYTDALALKEEVLQRKETRLREMEQEKEQYTILLAEKEKELQEKGKDLREKELELLAMKQANKKYRETTDTRMPRPSGPDRPPAKKNPLLGGAGSTRGTQVKKSLFQESGDDGKTDQSAKKRPKREDDGGKGHHEPDGCGAAACSTPQGGMTAATETLEDWYETALKEVSGQDIVREVGEDFLWRTCTEEAVSEAKKVWTNQGQTKAMKTATEAVCGGVAFIKSRKEKWGEAAVSEALRKGGQAMAILHVKGLLDWAMGRKEVGKKMVHVLIKGVKELVSAWREVVNMTCLEGGEPLPAPMEKDLADIRRGLDDVEDKFESCLNAVSGRVYDEVYINAKITNATTGNNS